MNMFGTTRRIYTIGMSDCEGYVETYWIEGIGSMQGVFANVFFEGSGTFLSCEIDGKTIYTADDFFGQLTTHITDVPKGINARDFYDLQGRRLLHEPEKGMYIKDGRKYLKT